MDILELPKVGYAIIRCKDGNIVGGFNCNNGERVLITVQKKCLLIRKLSFNDRVVSTDTLRELVKEMLD
ncbi:hypothetical protein ACVSUC_04215 [Yersinia enterocolitica]|uniref:Uncharacterized protein n=1 Tax=Yersinia enterocolitica TaxID=630 RepID=A0A9P1V0G0_YEREN|nr:hypothetical protein [Yersinia enterocolitica]EKN4711331.1 hypothetical protein [Yersinia enterocolitica]EKN4770147.1 hypothetical protein [Yersinia enterocolitica]EKN5956867.1 hypothetical protein [Yersinia enterocolitica]EKN5999880.1 hypothetical protein [Yersinia enterocolitica]EKN6388248.1 hypothetical protein [Yersinia enterocolitica]